MNPAAKAYYHRDLTGESILGCHNEKSNEAIRKVVAWFHKSPENNVVHTFFNAKQNKDVYMVALRGEDGGLIAYYEKHEFRAADETPLYEMK